MPYDWLIHKRFLRRCRIPAVPRRLPGVQLYERQAGSNSVVLLAGSIVRDASLGQSY